MRLRALNEFTAALPLVSPHGKLRSFGDNTETAIRSGVINGIVAEIADAFFRAQESCGVFDLILTGGDSELLFPLLENKGIKNVHLDLLLVERGLNMYARGGGKVSQVLECPAFFKN